MFPIATVVGALLRSSAAACRSARKVSFGLLRERSLELTFETDSTVTLSSLEKICSRERADPEAATCVVG